MKPTGAHVGRFVFGIRLRQPRDDVADLVGVGPGRTHAILRLAHLAGGHHFHGFRDLAGALHRLDLAANLFAYSHPGLLSVSADISRRRTS
jgi:hypothetical protein